MPVYHRLAGGELPAWVTELPVPEPLRGGLRLFALDP